MDSIYSSAILLSILHTLSKVSPSSSIIPLLLRAKEAEKVRKTRKIQTNSLFIGGGGDVQQQQPKQKLSLEVMTHLVKFYIAFR